MQVLFFLTKKLFKFLIQVIYVDFTVKAFCGVLK